MADPVVCDSKYPSLDIEAECGTECAAWYRLSPVERWAHSRVVLHSCGRKAEAPQAACGEPVQAQEEHNMTALGIKIPRDRLEAFCRSNGIHRLALFGSVLRDDFLPDSDVDVLVEFFPHVRVGLAFFRMQEELSAILGRRVDLHTPGTLSKYFRDEVLQEAEELYVAA